MQEFPRVQRLPTYVFNLINEIKASARARGEDIIDFGMGNPDQPTPRHIVDKLVQTAERPDTHRYSVSRGIKRLRQAICHWYGTRYAVDLDPATEAIVTIGSKEGLAHLALACTGPGDVVLVPNPTYPIHYYAFIISGADIRPLPLLAGDDLLARLRQSLRETSPKPMMLVLNFPSNPTAQCVDLDFFTAVVALAKEYGVWLVHDLAYADLVFDGYQAPSLLQVPGAKDIAVEAYTLSKSYNMPGWRVGFVCGNAMIIHNLARIKSYLDYGMFTPIQVAAIEALEGPQACVSDIRDCYQARRDVLCEGLSSIGWDVTIPKATMFVWAKIPPAYQEMGSLAFSKQLIERAGVAVSPGVGFGEHGDDHVRFSLIENEQRTRQAVRSLKRMFRADGLLTE